MAFSSIASRIHRTLPLLGSFAAAVLLASCGSDSTGVDTPGFARFSVQPQFVSGQFAPITLDRVEVLVERVTRDSFGEGSVSDTLLETSRPFSVTSNQLQLALRVPLQSSSEVLHVTLSYFAGTTLLFIGSDDIEVSIGQSANPEPFGMTYVGPGSNAVSLTLAPSDTTVTASSVTPFRATALSAAGADVGPFYLKWSLSSTANGASIDAAGVFHAPSQAATLWVKGLLPNGVDDSVQVTVTGRPATIEIVSGDHQTAGVNNALPSPFVVAVRSSNGTGIAGVTVNWEATVGGGQMDEDVSVTDGQGLASNIGIIGPNPGLNRFTATVAGAGTVTFSANEDQTGSTVTWIGNTNDVWSNAANWSGNKVPGVLDSVVIPSAEFYPVLDTTPIISALVLRGNGRITINDHGLAIIRGLTVLEDAYLEMINSSDAISIGGDVIFDGGNSTGHLTAGGISIAGSFEQRATNSNASFAPSGTHVMVLAGGPLTSVAFTTPGLGANQSHFNDIAWSGQGTLRLNSDVYARTMSASFQGTTTTISSIAGRTLHAAEFLTAGQTRLTFDNVALSLADTVDVQNFLSLITFQNMPTNRAQLTLNYAGGVITLNQFIFSTTPVAPNGFYIDATDTRVGDGSSLTVQVQNPTPTSMGNFFNEGGDAEIIWPFNPP